VGVLVGSPLVSRVSPPCEPALQEAQRSVAKCVRFKPLVAELEIPTKSSAMKAATAAVTPVAASFAPPDTSAVASSEDDSGDATASTAASALDCCRATVVALKRPAEDVTARRGAIFTPPRKRSRRSAAAARSDVADRTSEMVVVSPPQKRRRLRRRPRFLSDSSTSLSSRTPSPPSLLPSNSFEDLKYDLNRIEAKVKEAARVELRLLNKARMIRRRRALLMDKYRECSQRIVEDDSAPDGFEPAPLPPLLKEISQIVS